GCRCLLAERRAGVAVPHLDVLQRGGPSGGGRAGRLDSRPGGRLPGLDGDRERAVGPLLADRLGARCELPVGRDPAGGGGGCADHRGAGLERRPGRIAGSRRCRADGDAAARIALRLSNRPPTQEASMTASAHTRHPAPSSSSPPSTPVMRRKRSRSGGPLGTRAWFLVPGMAFLAVFSAVPIFQLVRMSVSEVGSATLNQEWPFVGLANYLEGFTSGAMVDAIIRTVVVAGIVTAIGMGLGLAAAIALRTTGRWSAIVLAGMVFVWALPPVVNGSVWKFLFAEDGLINVLVLLTPLRSEPIPFLYDATWALISVSLVTTWAVIP